MTESTSAAGAKTLDNGIRVLKAVAAHPRGLGVTEIAREVGVHRTVAYRLLGTLARHALVAQDQDGRYRLGLGVVELSMSLRSDLRSVAQPHLRDLAEATGATAHLTIPDGDDVVSIAVTEPANAGVHVAYQVGFRHPSAVGAAGLAILLGRPEQPEERPEVTVGRGRGFAASAGELQSGAWGLAAPVTGGDGVAVASVGVVALGPLDETATAPLVLRAAAAIRAGFPG
jgi:DNA-binding IclR family transcriptional regulator